jgi:hypothetical protein
MSPFRWDVLLVGFVLALPVVGLGLRGDLSAEEVMNRLLWCLGAGWAAVAVLRLASTPRPSGGPPARSHAARPRVTDPTDRGDGSRA